MPVDECDTNTGCGNCSYGCCCQCRNENCYLCKRKARACCNIDCGYSNRYSSHYICGDCKIGWKCGSIDRRSKETIEKDKYSNELICYDNSKCNQCSQDGNMVPLSTRVPKKDDKKGWELLRKLSDGYGLKHKKGYLSSKWSFGNMVHASDEIMKLLWIPQKLYEYDDWVEYMNTTKLAVNHYEFLNKKREKLYQTQRKQEDIDILKTLIREKKIKYKATLKDLIDYNHKLSINANKPPINTPILTFNGL